jgi:hypothetical protein
MSEQTEPEAEPMRYGNWLSTARATLAGLTLPGWVIFVGGIMGAVGLMIFSKFLAAGMVLAVAVLIDLVFIVRFGRAPGRTIAAMLGEQISGSARNASKQSQYVSGLFSELPPEQAMAIPGPLSNVVELDGTDGAGQRYSILHHPATNELVATFACQPDGTALQPQDQINTQVSQFGGWISSLSTDIAVDGAVVVVDAAMLDAGPLIDRIDTTVSNAAPQVAQDALREAARALPSRYPTTDVYASVVWSRSKLGGSLEDAAAEVAAKLPSHRAGLQDAGAGRVFTMTAEELARVVRIAYQPDRAAEYAGDDQHGFTATTRLTHAGPDILVESNRRVLLHDGVASMTAMMLVPPRMHITERFLTGLFAPSQKFLRKRVAIFYRPLTGADAVRRADQLRRATGVKASAKRQASSFDEQAQTLAKKLETELVTGASMTRFALQVTVTFTPTQKGYREATQQLKQLLEGSGIEWRFVEVGTAAAFHSTLPVGILPWQHRSIVQQLTEAGS